MSKRPLRWMAISDTHGDHLHAPTFKVQMEFAKYFKPEVRAHLGDVFDLRWLRKKASEEERRSRIDQDIYHGIDLLRRYQPTHICWGNHDKRLWDAAECDTGFVSELAHNIIDRITLAIPGTSTVPYDKRKGFHRLGDLSLTHGYTTGNNAVRQAAMAYGNVLMGHIHRSESVRIDTLSQQTGYAIGATCELDLPYNAASLGTLRQNHGFAYGFVHHGKTIVHLAQPIGGAWFLPTEFKQL